MCVRVRVLAVYIRKNHHIEHFHVRAGAAGHFDVNILRFFRHLEEKQEDTRVETWQRTKKAQKKKKKKMEISY